MIIYANGSERFSKQQSSKNKYMVSISAIWTRSSGQRSFLLFPAAESKRFADASQTETSEELVDTQAAQDAVHKTAQAQAVEQLAHQAEDTAEQQADGGDDLEERLGEETPQRTELLLRVRHVRHPLLGVVDGLDHVGRQFLEVLRQPMLFR